MHPALEEGSAGSRIALQSQIKVPVQEVPIKRLQTVPGAGFS